MTSSRDDRARSRVALDTVDVPIPTQVSRDMERAVDIVVDGLLGDVRGLQAEVLQLQAALTSRATIDQAKGIVMMRFGVDAGTAFEVLSRWSQVCNVKLRVIAQVLVDQLGQEGGVADLDPDVRRLVLTVVEASVPVAWSGEGG